MALDAGFLAAIAAEIRETALGGRVEKVYQPERDMAVLQMRTFAGGRRLLINAGSANPRIGFTDIVMENPQNPPLFCVLLRKHLSGAKLLDVRQAGFERVLYLEWECRDEMGFSCRRLLIAEIMGKYSNLIFTDGEEKILAVLRPVDFTTSSKRQLLPGMRYELPPAQQKQDPLSCTRERFAELFAARAGDAPVEKWLTATFLGISAVVAREITKMATGRMDTLMSDTTARAVFEVFSRVYTDVKNARFVPFLATDGNGSPVEYAFLPLSQYENGRALDSPSQLLDEWFGTRDREARVKQRAADVLHIVNNAYARILHKLELQRGELAQCEQGEQYRKMGDLIVSNCYRLEKGMSRAVLTDYEALLPSGEFAEVTVELDPRLAPTANAQRFFKKYNKSKTARVELTRQIAIGEGELAYLDSVRAALSVSETPTDLLEIREELVRAGYASRGKMATSGKKETKFAPAEYVTSGGYRVLCGKNNLQNEYITHKLADKNDFWFHAKNMPGSHVVMLLEGRGEPDAADFTEAAEIAALYSAAAGAPMTEVDYTTVRQLKKTAGARPGFVIYHTNWSAVVSPDKEKIAKMRKK